LAVSRARKEKLVEGYAEMLSKARLAVITNYQGLTVSELTSLRRQMRQAGIEFHVVKNTLTRRALQERGISTPDALWRGPNAIGTSAQDPVAMAKTFVEYAGNEKRLAIRAGILGNRYITDAEVVLLAELPSREVLLGQVLGGLQAPITGLVTVLSGTLRGLVNVLDARVRQLEKAGA